MQLINRSVHRWFEQTSTLTVFPRRFISTIIRAVNDSRFTLHTTGKLRRFWLVHFRKDYVQNQLLARKGDCRQCGICCNLLFTCPMLTKGGRCVVYGFCRPQACKVFPIDQRDIDEVSLCGGHCGYHFDGNDRHRIRNTGGA